MESAFFIQCIFLCDLVLYLHASVVGGGELYTWGSNENGCLGNGYE